MQAAAGKTSARASAARAANLGVRSHATGLPDGLAMNIAGGAKQLEKDASVSGDAQLIRKTERRR